MNQNMMKQIQQLQGRIAKAQEALEETTIEASSGGGAVAVVMNAQPKLNSITIQPEVVDASDVEMLQDLILAAVNEALNRSREMMAQEMSKLTGGMQIPGLF